MLSPKRIQRLASGKLSPHDLKFLQWLNEGKSIGDIATLDGVNLSSARVRVWRCIAISLAKLIQPENP